MSKKHRTKRIGKRGHVNVGQVGELSKGANWGYVRSMYKFGTYKGLWHNWLSKRIYLENIP